MTTALRPTTAATATERATEGTGVLPALVARPEIPLVTGGSCTYADLDVAASAPPLQVVAEHVAALTPYYASVHRGAGYASQVCTGVLERARTTVGRFLGTRETDVVVFTRSTTDALNLLARAVPGDVLRLDLEHHATLLAWRSGRVIPAAATIEQTLLDVAEELAARPYALLAVTGASNVTGEILPIERLAEIAHDAGARIVVDAAQLAPHRRIDIASSDVDYIALSGHKLYAPYGSGVLAGRRDWLDVAPPFLAGGGAVRRVTTRQGTDTAEVTWQPAPHRHEAGSPNVLGAAALAEACRALDPVLGPDGAAPAHERALLERLTTGLSALPGIRPLTVFTDAADRVGVCSFTVDGVEAGLVAAYLSAEHGIGVRDGKFCAHPLLQRIAPYTEGGVRVSLGLGTTEADVDRLLDALAILLTTGPNAEYAVVDGRWAPVADTRDLDPFGLAVQGDTTDVAVRGCGA